MKCRYCGSNTTGVHRRVCNEMRVIASIDSATATDPRFPHAKALILKSVERIELRKKAKPAIFKDFKK